MEGPIPQNTFVVEAVPLEQSRRTVVLEIANRPHPEHGRNREGPFDDRAQRFAHEALSPKRTGQQVTDIDSLISPRGNGTDQLPAIAAKDQPAIRFAGAPAFEKPLDDFLRFLRVAVR